MKDDLVEKMAREISSLSTKLPWDDALETWRNHCRKKARACLSAIESAGLVIVPRGSVSMLLEVHLQNAEADDWSINIGARPYMWHDTGAYVQAWDSLRTALAASPKHL